MFATFIKRLKPALLLAVFFATSVTILAQNVSVTIQNPAQYQLFGGSQIAVSATATSPFEVTGIVAKILSVQSPLSFTGTPNTFSGVISIDGIFQDTLMLTITATDAQGHTGSASVKFLYAPPPRITILQPVSEAVADPTIPVNVKCETADGSPCQLRVGIGPNVLEGTNELVGTLDLAYYGSSSLNGNFTRIEIKATDGKSQVAMAYRYIQVESSPYLKKVASVENKINDFDGVRILHVKSIDNIAKPVIYDIASGSSQIVPVPGNVWCYNYYEVDSSMATQTFEFGGPDDNISPKNLRLTPNGITFEFATVTWSRGDLNTWDGSNFTRLPFQAIGVGGDYLLGIRSSIDSLFRYQFSTNTTTYLGNHAPLARLAPNGIVAFKKDGQLNIFNGSTLSILPSLAGPKMSTLATDGILHAYTTVKTNPLSIAVWMNSEDGETMIDDYRPELVGATEIMVSDGYIAYRKIGFSGIRQIWVRDPAGVHHQITKFSEESRLEALNSLGGVIFTVGIKRFVADINGHYTQISEKAAGKTYWANGKWYLARGGTLFEIDTTVDKHSLIGIEMSGLINTAQPFSKSQVIESYIGAGAMLKLKVTELPKNGVLVLNGTKRYSSFDMLREDISILEYVPNPGFTGKDSIKWQAFNGIYYTSTPAKVTFTVNMGVCSKPPKPTITADGEQTVLTSSSESGNQWYLNGVLIADANGKTLHPRQAGTFTVKVTVEGGCVSDLSDDYNLIITGNISDPDPHIRYYPNPAAETITFDCNVSGPKTMNVFNIVGQPMDSMRWKDSSINVDLRSYASGLYFFTIHTRNGLVTGKFLKR